MEAADTPSLYPVMKSHPERLIEALNSLLLVLDTLQKSTVSITFYCTTKFWLVGGVEEQRGRVGQFYVGRGNSVWGLV